MFFEILSHFVFFSERKKKSCFIWPVDFDLTCCDWEFKLWSWISGLLNRGIETCSCVSKHIFFCSCHVSSCFKCSSDSNVILPTKFGWRWDYYEVSLFFFVFALPSLKCLLFCCIAQCFTSVCLREDYAVHSGHTHHRIDYENYCFGLYRSPQSSPR